ncbi:MAG TPA: hypothetical protein VFD46_14700 [Chryseolinea sp.]|nr:hypothetical protein [Chryseolinea sp.]
MKSKEYFSKLKSQGKISLEDYDKFVESIPEFEVPDAVVATLEENFLTRDRAAADKAINAKIVKEVLGNIDASIHAVLPEMPLFNAADIEAEKDTHKKLKLLKTGLKNAIADAKKTNGEGVSEELQKTIKDLTQRLEAEKKEKETVVSERENAIKEVMENSKKELKSYRLKNDIMGRLAKIEFAKEFSEDPVRKDAIMSYILTNLLKNDMDYDEQGQIVVQEINNGVAKPKFFPNSNDQITVDKLLETETKSFIKLNNGEGHQQGNGQTPITKVTSGTQKSGQTLAQRRAAAALSE